MAKQRSVKELETQLDKLNEVIDKTGGMAKATQQQVDAHKRITKELERQKSLYEESLSTNKEIDSTLQSIAAGFGKQSKIYDKTLDRLGLINTTVNGIIANSEKWNGSSAKNRKALENTAKEYRNVNAVVLKNVALLAEGKQTEEDISDVIQEQIKKHREVIASISDKAKHSKDFKKELEGEIQAMEKLAAGAKKAESNINAIAREGEKFAGTMAGGAIDKTLKAFGKKDGLGGVIKSIQGSAGTAQKGGGMGGMLGNVMGGVAKFLGPIGLAVGGIMAAAEFFNSGGAAKMAMRMAMLTGEDPGKASDAAFKQSQQYRDLIVEQNYGLPLKLQQQAEDDYLEYSIGVREDGAKYEESLIRDTIDYRMGLESDAIQFRQQQASQELDAQLSRNKTLFTTGMGYMKGAIGISERALQSIGSSTAAVLDTVKEYGYTLGIALKDQIALGAAAQGLGVRYGTTATEVFKMADTFRLMNKTSAKTGANLVAGLENFAKSNGMTPAQLYKEMADSQADILRLTSMTTEEYARQAVQLGNMNTSMASMLKASDSMVLNYKDSIKAEMSLSAMLGKNVNLSEVRAKLMSGDQAGGAAALKTALGGQDINAMNAFQKQALSQATGMGIQELMQLTQSTGDTAVKGSLEEQNAAKTGKAIANGALQQDIANAAAKLALDQKNRAEMLKFEQAKRMAMLFVEQQFKLKAIEREFTYREEREAKGAKQAMENAKMAMEKEVRAEQLMSLTDAYSGSYGAGKADPAKIAEFQAKTAQSMDLLQQAMTSGRISNSEVANIAMAMQKAAMSGKTLDVTQFAGVQTYQKDYEKAAIAKNNANTKMVADFDKFIQVFDKGGKGGFAEQNAYLKKAYPELYKQMESRSSTFIPGDEMGGTVLDKKMLKDWVASLKKQTTKVSTKPGGATTVGGKNKPAPVTLTPNKTPLKTETKTAPINLPKDAPKLADSIAQTKLQVQMVKLLGVSAQFLAQIDANTTAAGTVKIDGKPLSQALLNQSNKTYGIAGASY